MKYDIAFERLLRWKWIKEEPHFCHWVQQLHLSFLGPMRSRQISLLQEKTPNDASSSQSLSHESLSEAHHCEEVLRCQKVTSKEELILYDPIVHSYQLKFGIFAASPNRSDYRIRLHFVRSPRLQILFNHWHLSPVVYNCHLDLTQVSKPWHVCELSIISRSPSCLFGDCCESNPTIWIQETQD